MLIYSDVFTTGVSALDMCLGNCTWSGDKTVELYPWDAGTDDGITYMVCLLLLCLLGADSSVTQTYAQLAGLCYIRRCAEK